jgi:3'-phosphoadenosine 5'-phosphosulfate (PAPS) 3'-phosphatase
MPGGSVGRILARRAGHLVECGSVGLKACRVAAGEADIYAKAFRFRLWDVAPAQVLLTETACSLRLWSGQHLDYSGKRIEFHDLVVAPDALIELVLEGLAPP